MAKILLMEDDMVLQKMYRDKFETIPDTLIIASDGEEGLQKVRDEKPDFILLDLMMPKLSGVEVLSKLKTDAETRHIPVAILSVIAPDDSQVEGSEYLLKQVVAYFRKDESTPSEIVEKVKELLNK